MASDSIGLAHSFVAIGIVALTFGTAGHVVLHQKDARSAVGWLLVILLIPLLGVGLYWLLSDHHFTSGTNSSEHPSWKPLTPAAHNNLDCEFTRSHNPLITLGNRLVGTALLPGNSLTVFDSGENAYRAMLDAVDGATRSVALCVYQLDNDDIGRAFVRALSGAVHRGVDVRVVLDAFGARLSRPSIVGQLRLAGIPLRLFMPLLPWKPHLLNYRNHRKLLVVDEYLGFTGGMNIRQGHLVLDDNTRAIQDIHFQAEGPIVRELLSVFSADWESAGGEPRHLIAQRTPSKGTTIAATIHSQHVSNVFTRAVKTGPNDVCNKLRLLLMGAITSATSSIDIVTPYFLPDPGLLDALACAAMKGVRVRILIPEKNLRFMGWASNGLMPSVLNRGCLVFLSPPPYDHSKLVIIDELWSLVGSANWDERSFRLNFEFNLECFSGHLGHFLTRLVESKLARARQLSLSELDARTTFEKLRDGLFRLWSPFL